MQIFVTIAAVLLAFLSGSLPTALLLGRMKGIDIREHGSGNVGATNAFRVLGRTMGVLCLIIDALKGFLPVFLLDKLYLWGEVVWIPIDGWYWLMGIAAIAGHMFSPFLKFRGGKGVATTIGVMLGIAPLPLLICAVVGGLIIWLTGYVSLASIICSLLLPLLIFVLGVIRYFRIHAPIPWISVLLTLMLGLIIIWKHRANIKRLREGMESRIFDKLSAKLDESDEGNVS